MSKRLLALGADLKGAFAIDVGDGDGDGVGAGDGAGPRLEGPFGDLADEASLDAWTRGVEEAVAALPPEAIAVDLHPLYRSRAFGRALARRLGAAIFEVQHQHAHAEAVLAEHGVEGAALGLVLDGTGFGDDGTTWGFEALLLPGDGTFRRLGRLRPVPCPGGDAAAREPWRMAVAWAATAGVPPEALGGIRDAVGAEAFDAVRRLSAGGAAAPPTSSAGRAFDAAAALLGLAVRSGAEAEAAVALERAAAGEDARVGPAAALPFRIADGVLDLAPAFASLAAARRGGAAPPPDATGRLASAFHATVAEGAADLVAAVAPAGVRTVALAGGCFLNALLRRDLPERLRVRGFSALLPAHHPPTDAALPLGQLRAAARRFASGAADRLS